MKLGLYLLAMMLLSFHGMAQNTIGLPQIINYSKTDYHGGTQTWDIRQDSSGVLFFANNEGLITYDGTYWKNFPKADNFYAAPYSWWSSFKKSLINIEPTGAN